MTMIGPETRISSSATAPESVPPESYTGRLHEATDGVRWRKFPLVGVIMGSDSDLPQMSNAMKVLESFKIQHEVKFVSAHRTPDQLREYGRSAMGRGLRVIIAGAGGSAHLPGMIAAETLLPVMGVAVISSKGSYEEAIGSEAFMPPGVPLAFMGVGEAGATNAALQAVRTLMLLNPSYEQPLRDYVASLESGVNKKNDDLALKGWQEYLDQMLKK